MKIEILLLCVIFALITSNLTSFVKEVIRGKHVIEVTKIGEDFYQYRMNYGTTFYTHSNYAVFPVGSYEKDGIWIIPNR